MAIFYENVVESFKIYFKFSSEMVQTLGRGIQETESKTGFSANFEPLFIRMAQNRGHSIKKGTGAFPLHAVMFNVITTGK